MRTTRIELEGSAGRVTIARENGRGFVRVDSFTDPDRWHKKADACGEPIHKSWELPITTTDEKLFEVAERVAVRCAGCRVTNSMVHDYFRELQRVAF